MAGRQHDPSGKFAVKHGKYGSRVYNTWFSMKDRCLNPNNWAYHRYGGRGIKVYEPWVASFENFYEYVGEPPTPAHTLDRIDNDRGYEPGNTRWATRKEQQSNKHNNHYIELDGKRMTITQWSEYLGISRETLKSRITRGWTVRRALQKRDQSY